MRQKFGSNEIINPGSNVVDPAAQIPYLYPRPSFGYENTQILSHAPENPPQIYRGHRRKWGRTYINILHDPRVVRGNTYAAFVIPSSLQMEFLRMKEEEEKRKKLLKIPKKLPRVALMGRNRRDERDLNHKKNYERKREFELNKLQRTEAKYVRQEEEKQRRFKQKEQRKINDIIMQKKLMSNVFSKHFLKNLKGNTFRHLKERGFLSHHETYNTSLFMQQEYLPKAEKMNEVISFVDDNLLPLIRGEIDEELLERHKASLKKEKDRINRIEEAKKKAKEDAEKAERERREAQLKRREERRINRITENVKTKIIDQNVNKRDITSLSLMDIDELSIKGESINCLGGQLGEILFVFNEIMKTVEKEKPDINIKKLMKDFLKEFLSTGFAGIIPNKPEPNQPNDNKQQNNNNSSQQLNLELPNNLNNDNFLLELRYLESPKYDWENIPEERRGEFANFIKDDRRYISKSVHKMIELGILRKEYLDTFNEIISEMYFQGPIEPEKIEPDPSKAEDATYQEEIKKRQEEAEKKAQDENAFNEKIKKKIKINMIKPEVFKKKRNNIGAFIIVEPNPFEKGVVEEIEEVPISSQNEEEKKEGENEAPKEEEKKEEEKKEEEKKEEEKPKEENPEEKKEENEKVENVNQEVKEVKKEEVKEQSK